MHENNANLVSTHVLIRSGNHPCKQAVARLAELKNLTTATTSQPISTAFPRNIYILEREGEDPVPCELRGTTETDWDLKIFSETSDFFTVPCMSRVLLNFEVHGDGEEVSVSKDGSVLIRAILLRINGKRFVMPVLHCI